ncbi:PEP_CTERM-anchored TLD domain-containing protein [Roseibium sp. HPY-6]|uniref:PEP_CTERM-anchored TLD domain-containing protein n=1 Tax=Roseibium sp. HPY-6 TaxID=3229852 RepID=UPI00338DEE28
MKIHGNEVIRSFAVIIAAALFMLPGTANAVSINGGSSILTQQYATQLETWLEYGSIGLTNIFTKNQGDNSVDFHASVDGKGPTFSVISLDNGNVVGGFNPFSWDSASGYKRDSNTNAFLFNLTTSTKYDHNRYDHVTFNNGNHGPTFGGGHDLFINSTLSGGYANIGLNYGDSSQYGNTAYRNAFTGSYLSWNITGLEVFTIGEPMATVPVPAALPLMGGALAVFGFLARKRSRIERAKSA